MNVVATICSLALLAATSTAGATVIFFSDRAAFETAISVGQRVDFESSFSDASNVITFADATFSSTDGSGLHRTDAGTFGGSSRRLAAQNLGGMRIDLASGHFAIGLDVGELFDSAGGQFTLTGAGNVLLDSMTAAVGYLGNEPGFAGWVSTDEIGSLEFSIIGQSQFEAIDNVTLDRAGSISTNAIPAPATLVLLSLGLAGMACARRRRAS